MSKQRALLSHAVVAGIAALSAAVVTSLLMSGDPGILAPSTAQAQAAGQRSKEVITQVLSDLGREMRISVTERDPGNGSAPHRHPGHHTFGYVLEGTYEVKIDDGPVRQLKPGESFYEPPGSLHAVSRNPTSDTVVKYLVIMIADPTKPRTVPQ